MKYDLLIVGSGPAAYSCAITARQRNLHVIIAGAQAEQGWLYKAERLDNYPGLPAVSGSELLRIFREQAVNAGAEMMHGVVRQIQPTKGGYMALVGNDIVESKAVTLAVGAARPRLLPGEEDLLGHGVSWCGTCDGMFYRRKKVAVISYWKGGIEEAEFLSRLCSGVDYYVMAPHEIPESRTYQVMDIKVRSIAQAENGIELELSDGAKASYDGVFVFRPAVEPAKMLHGLLSEKAFIQVDRSMRTNLKHVYACGDCTGHPLQVAKAVGEGNIAAISAA